MQFYVMCSVSQFSRWLKFFDIGDSFMKQSHILISCITQNGLTSLLGCSMMFSFYSMKIFCFSDPCSRYSCLCSSQVSSDMCFWLHCQCFVFCLMFVIYVCLCRHIWYTSNTLSLLNSFSQFNVNWISLLSFLV